MFINISKLFFSRDGAFMLVTLNLLKNKLQKLLKPRIGFAIFQEKKFKILIKTSFQMSSVLCFKSLLKYSLSTFTSWKCKCRIINPES